MGLGEPNVAIFKSLSPADQIAYTRGAEGDLLQNRLAEITGGETIAVEQMTPEQQAAPKKLRSTSAGWP